MLPPGPEALPMKTLSFFYYSNRSAHSAGPGLLWHMFRASDSKMFLRWSEYMWTLTPENSIFCISVHSFVSQGCSVDSDVSSRGMLSQAMLLREHAKVKITQTRGS